MVTFPMTLTDPNPVFKVMAFLKSIISKNVASQGRSFYRTLIGNHTQSIKWYHFQ